MNSADSALAALIGRIESLASVNVEGGVDAWMRAVDEACAGLSARETQLVLVRALGILQETWLTVVALSHDLPGFVERTAASREAQEGALRDFRFSLAIADLG